MVATGGSCDYSTSRQSGSCWVVAEVGLANIQDMAACKQPSQIADRVPYSLDFFIFLLLVYRSVSGIRYHAEGANQKDRRELRIKE